MFVFALHCKIRASNLNVINSPFSLRKIIIPAGVCIYTKQTMCTFRLLVFCVVLVSFWSKKISHRMNIRSVLKLKFIHYNLHDGIGLCAQNSFPKEIFHSHYDICIRKMVCWFHAEWFQVEDHSFAKENSALVMYLYLSGSTISTSLIYYSSEWLWIVHIHCVPASCVHIISDWISTNFQ